MPIVRGEARSPSRSIRRRVTVKAPRLSGGMAPTARSILPRTFALLAWLAASARATAWAYFSTRRSSSSRAQGGT